MRRVLLLIILIGVLADFTPACAQVTDGRIGYWPLNGNLQDVGGGDHNGMADGVVYAVDRMNIADGACTFLSNGSITIPNSADFNFGSSSFSISAWIKSGSLDAGSIVAKQAADGYVGWNLWYNSGRIAFIAGHSPGYNIIESVSLSNKDNNWHHIVAVRIGNYAGDWKLYIDAQENGVVTQNDLGNLDFSTNAPMQIGRRQVGNTFPGLIDEVAVYNRALSVNEINELYSGTATPSQSCSQMYCNENGVGIGTSSVPQGYALAVKGKIMSEGVKVEVQSKWPDYVFEEEYRQMNLPELKKYIQSNGHLPEVPKVSEVMKEGIDLGEMNVLLLKKIEELTLSLIKQNEQMEKMKTEIKSLKKNK